MVFRIGLFHIQAHKETCQGLYTLTHTEGAGLLDGETVERVWSETNGVGAATSQMGSGHRHDILNETFNAHNWRKLLERRTSTSIRCTGVGFANYVSCIADALTREWYTASRKQVEYAELVAGLDERIDDTSKEAWLREVEAWEKLLLSSDGRPPKTARCPYTSSTDKGGFCLYAGWAGSSHIITK